MPELIRHGKVVRPGLGFQAAADQIAAQLGVKGVLVVDVPAKSSAAKAGIRPTTRDAQGRVRLGDVIVGVDGKKIESVNDLYLAMEQYKVGDTVSVALMRDGKTVQVKGTLQAIDETSG